MKREKKPQRPPDFEKNNPTNILSEHMAPRTRGKIAVGGMMIGLLVTGGVYLSGHVDKYFAGPMIFTFGVALFVSLSFLLIDPINLSKTSFKNKELAVITGSFAAFLVVIFVSVNFFVPPREFLNQSVLDGIVRTNSSILSKPTIEALAEGQLKHLTAKQAPWLSNEALTGLTQEQLIQAVSTNIAIMPVQKLQYLSPVQLKFIRDHLITQPEKILIAARNNNSADSTRYPLRLIIDVENKREQEFINGTIQVPNEEHMQKPFNGHVGSDKYETIHISIPKKTLKATTFNTKNYGSYRIELMDVNYFGSDEAEVGAASVNRINTLLINLMRID